MKFVITWKFLDVGSYPKVLELDPARVEIAEIAEGLHALIPGDVIIIERVE